MLAQIKLIVCLMSLAVFTTWSFADSNQFLIERFKDKKSLGSYEYWDLTCLESNDIDINANGSSIIKTGKKVSRCYLNRVRFNCNESKLDLRLHADAVYDSKLKLFENSLKVTSLKYYKPSQPGLVEFHFDEETGEMNCTIEMAIDPKNLKVKCFMATDSPNGSPALIEYRLKPEGIDLSKFCKSNKIGQLE